MSLKIRDNGVWVDVAGSGGSGGNTPPPVVTGGDGWNPPTYWLDVPEVVDTDQVFYGLLAVFPNDSRPAGFRAQGNYTIDWGDGSAPVNVASNVTAEKLYNWNALFQPLDFEEAGYTVADWNNGLATTPTILADPTGGGNGNVLRIVKNAGRQDWTGAAINAPQRRIPFSATEQKMRMKFYSPAQGKLILLRVETSGGTQCTAGASTTVTNGWETLTFDFSASNNPALNLSLDYVRLIVIPDYYNQDETLNLTYYVAEIAFDGKAGQITEQGYKQCLVKVTPQAGQSLTLVDPVAPPVGEHSSGIGTRPRSWLMIRFALNNAGSYSMPESTLRPRLCESFEYIASSGVGAFPLQSSFYGWRSLKRVVFPVYGSNSRANLIRETGLTKADIDLSTVAADNLSYLANGSNALVAARLKVGTTTNNLDRAFYRCDTLRSMELDLSPSSSEINFNLFAAECNSLTVVKITGLIRATISINFGWGNLSWEMLNHIFDRLEDRTSLESREIIITGNPGISQAGYDPSIATGKNWVVTA